MICPYCDSQIEPIPGNGICPNCGGRLNENNRTTQTHKKHCRFPDPPLGIYDNTIGDHIEITKDAVVFRKKIGLFGNTKQVCAIPYTELHAVQLHKGGTIIAGFLSVRSKKNKYVQFPKNAGHTADDDMAITFRMSMYKTFYPIYMFLKQCADIVNAEDNAE